MIIHIDNECFSRKLTLDQDEKLIKMRIGRLRSNFTRKDVNIQQLADSIAIGRAFISGSVIDTNVKSLKGYNVHNFCILGIDVDNDGGKIITANELVKLINKDLGITPVIYYETYSCTKEHPRFRLLYVFKKPIKTNDEYRDIYNRLKYLYPDFIDTKCANSNRVWNGTNKIVKVNSNISLIDKDFFQKLKEKTDGKYKIEGMSQKTKDPNLEYISKKTKDPNLEYISKNATIKGNYNFNWSYKDEIIKFVKENTDIEEFLNNEGFEEVDRDGIYIRGICPFHANADNIHGFLIDTDNQKAFCMTHECTGGDIIDFVQTIYNLDLVNALKKITEDFNLTLDDKYILKSRKTNNNIDLTNKFLYGRYPIDDGIFLED